MKKILFLAVLLSFVVLHAQTGQNFVVAISGSLLLPADSGFKTVYGNTLIYPEIMAGYNFYKDFYAYAGYGFLSKTGKTPELEAEAKTNQSYISIGAGIRKKLGEKFSWMASAGVCFIHYKEEALETTISDDAVGFRVDGFITYDLSRNIFLGATLGYIYGTDTPLEESINLGGFKAGLVAGARF